MCGMFVCMCVYTYVWGSKVNVGSLNQPFFTFFTEAGSLT